jgi:hypothetical protein
VRAVVTLTIPDAVPYVEYTVGGTPTATFAVPFPITDDLDLVVRIGGAGGVTLDAADYAYTPDSDVYGGYPTGEILLDVAVSDTTVEIWRDIPVYRTSEYGSGPLSLDDLNADMARVQAQLQDVRLQGDLQVSAASEFATLASSWGYAASTLASQQIKTVSAPNGSFAGSILAFLNSNGVSWSTTTGSAVVASHNGLTTAALSNHSHGDPTLALTNISGTTASNSAGLTLSLSAGAGGAPMVSAGTTSNTLATQVFSNSNGVSFGLNGSTITASHNGLTTAALSNHSHGNPTLNLTNLSGTTASNSAGLTISLSAVNALTTAMLSNAATISNIRVSGGTTSNLLSALTFGDANGISFGLNASTLTASHNGLTTAALSNHSHGNPTLNLTNLSGTTASNSAGFTLSLSGAAGAAQTNQTLAAYAVGNTTGQSSSSTWDARTLSVQGAGIASVGWSNGSLLISAVAAGAGDGGNTLAAGTQTASTNGNVVFADSNGITFGMSGSTRITASHNGLTTAMLSNAVTLSNIRVSGGTTSNLLSALTFGDANGVSFGLNAGTLTASHNGLTTAALSNHSHGNPTLALTNLSGTTASNSAGFTLSLSAGVGGGGGGVGAGVSTGGNTAGSTGTVTTGNVVFVGSGVISLSQSTAGAGSAATISILAPATSSLSATGRVSLSSNGSTISIGVGSTLSGYVLQPLGGYGGDMPFAQSSASIGQNSVVFYPFMIEEYLTCDHIRIPCMVTNSSSGAASVQKGQTIQLGIYTRHSTNSSAISRLYSTSYTIAASHNSNVSMMLSMITAIGNSTSYNTVSASSAGLNISASLHGPRELVAPVSSLLTPGEYWIGYVNSTSSVGAGGNVLNISNIAVNLQTYNRLGLSTATSNTTGFYPSMGMGNYSVTSGALPASLGFTELRHGGVFPILFAATGTV